LVQLAGDLLQRLPLGPRQFRQARGLAVGLMVAALACMVAWPWSKSAAF
jgi:hypothetical protein